MQDILNDTADQSGGDAVKGQKWNKLYEVEVTPWNLRKPSPLLILALEKADSNGQVAVDFTRSVVPGCGEGFDVSFLAAKPGAVQSVGLDISELAVQQAQKLNGGVKGAHFEVANFFEYTPEVKFTLAFDYTFFCAIHPSLRQKWAVTYARIMAPGSLLITGIFPITYDRETLEAMVGPPYPLNFDSYIQMLKPVGFECVLGPVDVPKDISTPHRAGREQIAIWKLN
ncbi:hypothetical protein MP228_005662 [Amoeboaphelidium protococcarum]|nr:hypothetical protein MP228_005662 [Amoeboaphelidium protococcarum]